MFHIRKESTIFFFVTPRTVVATTMTSNACVEIKLSANIVG